MRGNGESRDCVNGELAQLSLIGNKVKQHMENVSQMCSLVSNLFWQGPLSLLALANLFFMRF